MPTHDSKHVKTLSEQTIDDMDWREEFAIIMNQLDCNVAMKMSLNSFFTSKLEEIRTEIGNRDTIGEIGASREEIQGYLNGLADAQQILTQWIEK